MVSTGPDSTERPAAVVVLAAGQGTRMRSATPKVLHALGGRSMLGHAMAAARELDPQHVAVVVRHERDLVAAAAAELDPAALVVDQDEVPGTGRAVQCALDALDARAHAGRAAQLVHDDAVDDELHAEHANGGDHPLGDGLDGAVVVLAGDIPLLDGATLGQLLAAHHADGNAVTVLTTEVADATGYGRIVREAGTGDVLAIVEHKDADAEQRAIREINAGLRLRRRRAAPTPGRTSTTTTRRARSTSPTSSPRRAPRAGPCGAVLSDDPMLVEGVNDRVAARHPRRRAQPARAHRVDAVPASPSSTPRPPGWTSTSSSTRTSPCCPARSCTAPPRSTRARRSARTPR